MTRINLVKYGFVRWPENDFSDDGSKFTCFRAGKNVRVSKCVADGQVYLSIDSAVGKRTLPYDVYKELPHYNDATWKYNGVSVASLTDKDLIDFYNACMLYEMEYEEAESKIMYPTIEEITNKATRITAKRMAELEIVEFWMKNHALAAATMFNNYEWREVQDCIRHLVGDATRFNPETYPQKILNTSRSFDFVKPEYEMQENFWFTKLKELFSKYDLN